MTSQTTPDWALLARQLPQLAKAIERLAAEAGCRPYLILKALEEIFENAPEAPPTLSLVAGGKE